jgi:hypothetical protein
MPITPNNPFKGQQHPGELIILCLRLHDLVRLKTLLVTGHAHAPGMGLAAMRVLPTMGLIVGVAHIVII